MKEFEYAKQNKDCMSYLIANYICSTCDIVLKDIQSNLGKDGKKYAKDFYDLEEKNRLQMIESVQRQVKKSLEREF